MTYSSIYPFYFCSSSKHTSGEGPSGDDTFEQAAALTSTIFNPNEWKVKNCYSHAGLGITHGADALVPKEPAANLCSFSSPYGTSIGLSSAGMDAQVKVEEPELLQIDTLPTQETTPFGNCSHDVDSTSRIAQHLSHRKYSIESVPGLYRDTCSPFGNYPGENSSSENSPQPYFADPEFIGSPIIQSPSSPGSFICLEDTAFQVSSVKETCDSHHASIIQQPSPVYPSSLVSSQQTSHFESVPNHPYYHDNLETHSSNDHASFEKMSTVFGYSMSIEPEFHHLAGSKKRMLDDTKIKTEEPQYTSHTESMQSGWPKSMAAGQRNRSTNRPPTSMMTTFSSRITSLSAKRYHCAICQKGFSRPSSLNTHMYSHTGEKPFQCPYEGCGRHFSVVSNLRRHTKIHSGKAG
ncbi:hypothetical protein K493DRAFT_312626 [Basidiobolus meristosporus CBS 931.73]|uniref:C2H2-type domain-containing protein n=1 Tax=Basidiobolus meristosporus CBS 931.73 TaxID=1314790 RepID=A0A1Y1YSB5_9FUNG|nr:hypothetical protein K493DRAFT_312626 [Basidiobolus meristosporus CBS 931.73]|eukprot:ORY00918.1 hypothetical protein K493DRAFT_312626 [Basidiobolus meristosporus CBS 931.73]